MKSLTRACLFAAAFLGALVVAQESAIEVEIVSPAAGTPLFDEVEIEARVRASEPVSEVGFYVDGHAAGTVRAPPYRLRVDVGGENRARRIRVVAHGASGASGESVLTSPRLEIDEALDLELQQLYASVTTPAGRRVLDLERGDFTVFDGGVEQEIVTFERGDLPLAAALLVDSSVSMEGRRFEASRQGAELFLSGLKPLDEARLLLFSDRILHLGPPLQGGATGPLSLDALATRGGTAVNDHLYLALHWLETRHGRRVAVLLTDGGDNHSVLDIDQVREAARYSQAILYWVCLEGRRLGARARPLTTWRGRLDARKELQGLEATVRESGGKVFTLRSIEELVPAFRVILAELRQQYALGYYPTERHSDGSWRQVRIELARPGLELRTRDGYYDR